jgi:ubiquinone/menaquinone biosynthesis C-methylase UbiE
VSVSKDPEQNETKQLRRFVDFAGKHVLEIGCGEGRLTWRYAALADQVIGIDPDRDALRVAGVDRSSDLEDKVTFVNAQAEHLPFHKEKFDIAVLAWSL